MPNPGDFDPAKAIQGARRLRAAEEAEKQRVLAQEDLYRANILKLLRYAEERVEAMENPVVSEFVFTEKWRTKEWITRGIFSGWKLRPHQQIIRSVDNWLRLSTQYEVMTWHERQTRYYGSWLSLDVTAISKRGLVKLRQPRAGYAFVDKGDWDPRNVSNITVDDYSGLKKSERHQPFLIFASLEEVIEEIQVIRMGEIAGNVYLGGRSVEELTKYVTQALDFVATGQPPEQPPAPPPIAETYD